MPNHVQQTVEDERLASSLRNQDLTESCDNAKGGQGDSAMRMGAGEIRQCEGGARKAEEFWWIA